MIDRNSLTEAAKNIRKCILQMIYEAQSGHPGGSLSIADIIAVLYFHEMRIDPKNPSWEDRDRFVLSKGHACPAQYAALALRGYFDMEILSTLRREGSILQGHPDMKRCPGIDISTGSLGQGISAAVGMAYAGKYDQRDYRVYCILGDGECNEGQVWEAAQSAVKYQLDNLITIVDHNRLQCDDFCDATMPTLDIQEKFRAFGFETAMIDGHNIEQIVQTLNEMKEKKNGKPKCIVANTVKGKGVSFMENAPGWHGMAPNTDQYKASMKEIEEG